MGVSKSITWFLNRISWMVLIASILVTQIQSSELKLVGYFDDDSTPQARKSQGALIEIIEDRKATEYLEIVYKYGHANRFPKGTYIYFTGEVVDFKNFESGSVIVLNHVTRSRTSGTEYRTLHCYFSKHVKLEDFSHPRWKPRITVIGQIFDFETYGTTMRKGYFPLVDILAFRSGPNLFKDEKLLKKK